MAVVLENPSEIQELYDSVEEDFFDINYGDYFANEAVLLEELHRAFFDRETAPDGTRWPPLSPKTIKRKGHSRILIDSHRLMRSLVGKSTDSVREIVTEQNNQGMSFGTLVPYSRFHSAMDGATRLPIREHVGLTDEYADDATERVADYTLAELKDAS